MDFKGIITLKPPADKPMTRSDLVKTVFIWAGASAAIAGYFCYRAGQQHPAS